MGARGRGRLVFHSKAFVAPPPTLPLKFHFVGLLVSRISAGGGRVRSDENFGLVVSGEISAVSGIGAEGPREAFQTLAK